MNTTSTKTHIFIGDIHGRDSWKKIVEQESQADVFIFYGDYFDSKGQVKIAGPKQLSNFLDIVAFKNSLAASKQEAILLFGNHDFHYMPWFKREPYSGFLPYMAKKYQRALVTHFSQLQIAYAYHDLLCTHAGVSIVWLEHFLNREFNSPDWANLSASELADIISQFFEIRPLQFDFNGFNPFGDDPCQSPIWLRPNDMMQVNKGNLEESIIQIFGHTVVYYPEETFNLSKGKYNQRYFQTDMLGKGFYLKYENKEFQLCNILKE